MSTTEADTEYALAPESEPTDEMQPDTDTDSAEDATDSEPTFNEVGTAAEEFRGVDWESMPVESGVAILINYAFASGCSDMFYSAEEDRVEITARRIGIVEPVVTLPSDLGGRYIAHIRAMASFKFDEHRKPQDGRWTVNLPGEGKRIDLRLNSLPTLYGETIAMRLLPRDSNLKRLQTLGFVGPQFGEVESILQSSGGLVLVTGPTGSGKTTTLYGFLHELNDGRRKIHTIEDPVEAAVSGLHQSQVNEVYGPTFADLLQGVLRQGPDVIMVGEIRDRVTADTAVRAANSGTLVFASVHASSASKAVESMLSLHVSPYFLATSLLAVIGQRLMRTLDRTNAIPVDLCHAPQTFDEIRPWLDNGEGNTIYAANGGRDDSGYVGQTGTYEILSITSAVQQLIRDRAPAGKIASHAVQSGMLDLRRAALVKIAKGITSFDEMYRLLPEGDEPADGSAN